MFQIKYHSIFNFAQFLFVIQTPKRSVAAPQIIPALMLSDKKIFPRRIEKTGARYVKEATSVEGSFLRAHTQPVKPSIVHATDKNNNENQPEDGRLAAALKSLARTKNKNSAVPAIIEIPVSAKESYFSLIGLLTTVYIAQDNGAASVMRMYKK